MIVVVVVPKVAVHLARNDTITKPRPGNKRVGGTGGVVRVRSGVQSGLIKRARVMKRFSKKGRRFVLVVAVAIAGSGRG